MSPEQARGTGGAHHRNRDRRVHHVSVVDQRHRRHQADCRSLEPLGHPSHLPLPGHRGTDDGYRATRSSNPRCGITSRSCGASWNKTACSETHRRAELRARLSARRRRPGMGVGGARTSVLTPGMGGFRSYRKADGWHRADAQKNLRGATSRVRKMASRPFGLAQPLRSC